MFIDAERLRRDLDQANEAGGHLFKIRDDPRVTPVGGCFADGLSTSSPS